MIPFKFYDGKTGETHEVVKVIDDGKTDIVVDHEMKQDIDDLIRWGDEGGMANSPVHQRPKKKKGKKK